MSRFSAARTAGFVIGGVVAAASRVSGMSSAARAQGVATAAARAAASREIFMAVR